MLTLKQLFSIQQKQQTLFQYISQQTAKHASYLTSIGLADRARHFKVKEFSPKDIRTQALDLTPFEKRINPV